MTKSKPTKEKEEEKTLSAEKRRLIIEAEATPFPMMHSFTCDRCGTKREETPFLLRSFENQKFSILVCKTCLTALEESQDALLAKGIADITKRIAELESDVGWFYDAGYFADAAQNQQHIDGLKEALLILASKSDDKTSPKKEKEDENN